VNRDSEDAINQIIEKFDRQDKIILSEAYGDGGTDPLFPRLGRAALNQACEDGAAIPRYAIWANTVRDNILRAIELFQDDQTDEANRYLIRASNSLSAFVEIQALFHSLKISEHKPRHKKETEGA
jgi:hypothetical protein